MPSVVSMDSNTHNGPRTDHDRETSKSDGAVVVNGATGPAAQEPQVEGPPRMNDLPDEIIHITQNFVPLSLLLTRLAQTSHNALQDKIIELAKMPAPAAAAVNGNSSHSSSAPDDASAENIRKKASLLNFAQDWHTKWVKALVITEWSRKASMVSKLIDLKVHLDQQRQMFENSMDYMVNVKRDLSFARLPSPDLKTALQVLSTGSAPWLPDFQYIEPPPLTIDEQLKWINDLNTLLSIRLNLEEFDKIPPQFKDYKIGSGRVTFRVASEFEVDLTIVDEDSEKQFWFVDFRFAFEPAASSLSPGLMQSLTNCVNEALAKDGLAGCYQFLHEFVLTSKINELKRQALKLSKSSWTGTLMVEPLHRALAIQYWTSRTPPNAPKSWVLVAVNSGRPSGTQTVGGKNSSHLVAKWYRDNKEVGDVKIPLDVENLSAESLLRAVIGRHIEFILTSIHDKLLETARFKNHEAAMVLHIHETDPSASYLTAQVGFNAHTTLLMEPMTGLFAVKPQSKFVIQYELQLNNGRKQIEDGFQCLENVRCAFVEEELNRRGSCMDWHTRKPQITAEEVKAMTRMRDWSRLVWLQRAGWGSNWFVGVFLTTRGDVWFLIEVIGDSNRSQRRLQARLPLDNGNPDLSDTFWSDLTVLTTGMIAQSIEQRELHRQQVNSLLNNHSGLSMSGKHVRLPTINIELATIFPGMVGLSDKSKASGETTNPLGALSSLPASARSLVAVTSSAKQPWAHDNVILDFKGVQMSSLPKDGNNSLGRRLICVCTANIKVRKPSRLAALKGKVDRDVSFNLNRGEFYIHIQHAIGDSALSAMKSRILAIDRFVSFMDAMEQAPKGTITSDVATLQGVTCFYKRAEAEASDDDAATQPKQWRVMLDLSQREIRVQLEQHNPHLRVFDLVKRLVNLEGGIKALMVWLPASLSMVTAIDKIQNAWDEIQTKGQGEVEFLMDSMDWMRIQYTIKSNDPAQRWKRLTLDCRIFDRKEEPWWNITRYGQESAQDEFATALGSIMNGKGKGWQGLISSAAGRVSGGGAARLLLALDEKVRALIGSEGLMAVEPAPKAQVQTQAQPKAQTKAQRPGAQQTQQRQPKNGKGPEQAIEIG